MADANNNGAAQSAGNTAPATTTTTTAAASQTTAAASTSSATRAKSTHTTQTESSTTTTSTQQAASAAPTDESQALLLDVEGDDELPPYTPNGPGTTLGRGFVSFDLLDGPAHSPGCPAYSEQDPMRAAASGDGGSGPSRDGRGRWQSAPGGLRGAGTTWMERFCNCCEFLVGPQAQNRR